MRPHLTLVRQSARGIARTELLLVIAMVSVVVGFVVVSFIRGNRTGYRANTAVEIANYLQKARTDSMRRSAKDIDQMAQVNVFNRRFYSITIDGDNDGHLDIPLVMSLPEEQGVGINGPFPKTYLFDWQGQTVDSQEHRVAPPTLTVGDSDGASAIKFSDDGKVIVLPAVKLVASK